MPQQLSHGSWSSYAGFSPVTAAQQIVHEGAAQIVHEGTVLARCHKRLQSEAACVQQIAKELKA